MGEVIEETVISILKASDLETATELSIRTTAAERLGVDRFNLDQKRLIRTLIDSFLLGTLSTTPPTLPARGTNGHILNEAQQPQAPARVTNEAARGANEAARVTSYGGGNGVYKFEGVARVTNKDGGDIVGRETRSGKIAPVGDNEGGNGMNHGGVNGVHELEVEARVKNEVAGVNGCDGGNGVQQLEVAGRVTNVDGGNGVQAETGTRAMESGMDNENELQHLGMAACGTNKDGGNGVREMEMVAGGMNNGVCGIVLGLEVPQEHNKEGGCEGGYVQDGNAKIICELSQSRDVTVHDFRGQSMVTIRDRYQKDSVPLPKIRRTSLTTEEWLSMKNNIPAIEEAITRMQTRLRFPAAGKQSDPYECRPNSISAQANVSEYSKEMDSFYSIQESILEGSKQMEVESALPPSRLLHMPIRLDGKNYYFWKHQMEFLLAESKVAYVLTEACPSISTPLSGTGKELDHAKTSTQKWADDDFICRHKILTCLCDNLYNDYSKKAFNAKELWEELKSVYDEDIGTRRSQINKYVQFQIVDGVSILEQVNELQRIAHFIRVSGTWIDEYFHVSLIISKLPPSWKEFRLRMMRKEVLPLDMLMHCLKVEEDAHNTKQLGKHSKSDVGSKCESRVGSQGKEKKRFCYNCKKEGHISYNCPDKKTEVSDNGNTKENGRSYKWTRDLHHM